MNILELLETQARDRPHKMALLWLTRKGKAGITWGELASRVRGLAGGLISLGITPGDRVVNVMANGADLLCTSLGTMASGGVDTSIDPMNPGFVVRRSLLETKFRFKVVTDDIVLGMTENAGFVDQEGIIFCEPTRRNLRQPTYLLQEIMARGEGVKVPQGLQGPSKMAVSSGRTGRLKRILLTQSSLMAAGQGLASTLRLGPKDTYLSLSHLSSSWALQEFLACAQRGSTMAIMDHGPHFMELARALGRLAPTVLRMSSEVLMELYRTAFDYEADDEPWTMGPLMGLRTSLAKAISRRSRKGRQPKGGWMRRLLFGSRPTRLILSTGSVGENITALLGDMGYPVLHTYGITEACGFVTMSEAGAANLGRPLEGVGLEIGEDGEIVVSGPTVMAGYHNMEERNQRALQDGKLHTSDQGRLDGQGNLLFQSSQDYHSKAMNGEDIPSDQIAEVLMGDEMVRRALVIPGGHIEIPYPVALVVPALGNLKRLAQSQRRGFENDDEEAPTGHVFLNQDVMDALERRLAKRLSFLPPEKRPQKFIFLPSGPSLKKGELCPDYRPRTSLYNMRRSGFIQAIHIHHKPSPDPGPTGRGNEPIFVNVESEYDRPMMRSEGIHHKLSVKTEKVLTAGIPSLLATLEHGGYTPDYLLYRFRWVGAYREQTESLVRTLVERPGKIIAVSCASITLPFVLKTLSQVHAMAPEKKFILGGCGPGAASRQIIELFPYINVVVNGEGEKTFPLVLDALLNGKDPSTIKGISCRAPDGSIVCDYQKRLKDLDSLPQPSYKLVDPKDYTNFSVSTMRGCPNKCKYCGNRAMYGPGVTFRDLDLVMDEMKMLQQEKGQTMFWVCDDTFTLIKPRVLEFCSRVEKTFGNKATWFCYTSVDTLDEEMMEAMAASGCTVAFLGIESGSNKMLRQIKGTQKAFTFKDAIDRMALASRYFASVQAGLIVGFPEEDWEDFLDTLRLAYHITREGYGNIVLVWLKPIPLTPLFELNRSSLQLAQPDYPYNQMRNYVTWAADLAMIDPALAPWATMIPSPLMLEKVKFLREFGEFRLARREDYPLLSQRRRNHARMARILDPAQLFAKA